MKIITQLIRLYLPPIAIPLSIFIAGLCLIVFFKGGHENPLSINSKEQNIAFLREAAISAEKEMHLAARKGGRFYSNCMEDNKEGINCQQFFNQMLKFAKTSSNYKQLTYADLTNTKSYAVIAEDYQIKLFNHIDY